LTARLLLTTSWISRGPALGNMLVEGRRGAKVKSQGHYNLKPKRTIPKKLGAKRTGGMSSLFFSIGAVEGPDSQASPIA